MPWIESREDFVAYFTQGEDPDVVRRYSEGPEEELIEYLGEVFLAVRTPGPEGWPPGGRNDEACAGVESTTRGSTASFRGTTTGSSRTRRRPAKWA